MDEDEEWHETIDIEEVGIHITHDNVSPVMKEKLCVICIDEMAEGDLVVLKCLHVLHKECLRPWVSQNAICPTCRCHLI